MRELWTRIQERIDALAMALILFSVVTLSIETLPDLAPSTVLFLRRSEQLVSVLFTLEYIYRLYRAKPRLKYVFSFFGLVDLLSIIPFYLSLGIDLRGIRAVRLVRVLRLFKLTRYTKALERIRKAIVLVKEELVLYGFATALVVYLAATGIFYFERDAQPEVFQSIPHSLWWAVTTLTTVGYGDSYPITVGGKLFTFVVLMAGLGIVAIPSGLLASALSTVRENESALSKLGAAEDKSPTSS